MRYLYINTSIIYTYSLNVFVGIISTKRQILVILCRTHHNDTAKDHVIVHYLQWPYC